MIEALHASSRQDIAARNPNPRIKTGSDRSKPELLHNALFQGLYMHLIAFVEARAPGPVEIEVRTDRVDGPIAKLFRVEAARLLDNSPRVRTVTAYDTVDKKVVEGRITSTTKWPDSMEIKTEVVALTINPTGDDDPLTVAADVLANPGVIGRQARSTRSTVNEWRNGLKCQCAALRNCTANLTMINDARITVAQGRPWFGPSDGDFACALTATYSGTSKKSSSGIRTSTPRTSR